MKLKTITRLKKYTYCIHVLNFILFFLNTKAFNTIRVCFISFIPNKKIAEMKQKALIKNQQDILTASPPRVKVLLSTQATDVQIQMMLLRCR